MTLETRGSMNHSGGAGSFAALAALAFSFGFFSTPVAVQAQSPAPEQQTFSSAADATRALIGALQNDDQPALLKVLGPDGKDVISSGDDVEDKDDASQFVQKYQQMHRLVKEPDGTTTLYIGAENWPTPIPLMSQDGKWYFDTAAGKQEVLYRRIGKNELAVIQTCRELVYAENEYYSKPHDGGSGKQYAQKFFSDPDKHDGLYWKTSAGESESPIGPLVASAATEGYERDPSQSQQPFEGYYFKMLEIPAAGAAHGGFAFVAYPAMYRSSGVMTFIVDQDGIVYEKDLGHRTDEIAKSLKQYGRDATWRKAD